MHLSRQARDKHKDESSPQNGVFHFSQATVADGAKFWGVQEDLDGFTEFMRVYLEKYNRWLSPLYLAGESYGTFRSAVRSICPVFKCFYWEVLHLNTDNRMECQDRLRPTAKQTKC